MFQLTLPDGRRCSLAPHRDPAADPTAIAVQVAIDGEPAIVVPLTADWEQTAALPPVVVDAIIRHFLMQ